MEEEDPAMVTEVDDDDENWMDSPVAAAPVPPPPTAPVPPAAPAPPAPPVAPAAPAVLEVVPPAGPEEENPGWTTTIHYKYPSLTAYFHNLLREMLDTYYADKEIGIRYCCAEYTHPYEASGTAVQSTHTPMRPHTGGRILPSLWGMRHMTAIWWRASMDTLLGELRHRTAWRTPPRWLTLTTMAFAMRP
jgi:hypothetical protein